LELVSSGVGVALLPNSALAQFDMRNFAISNLIDPIIPWRIDLVWLKNGHESVAQKSGFYY
jgi:DNA-binding transcriptional LysR family regulator